MKKIIMIIGIILISINVAKSDWGPSGELITTNSVTITCNCNYEGLVNSTIHQVNGDPQIDVKGIVWSTSPDPTVESHNGGGYTSQGIYSGCTSTSGCTGSFNSTMNGLTESTTYYVKSYATVGSNIWYSAGITFTTIPLLPTWGLIALGSIVLLIGGFYVRKMFV